MICTIRSLSYRKNAPFAIILNNRCSINQQQHRLQHQNVADSVAVPEPRISGAAASFKRGTGGRSSFSGNVITVFGASGFIGNQVVNRLAREGSQLILPHRCDPYDLRESKVVGDLGQILFFPFNLKDDESIRKVVKYSNIVINLIGSFIETSNYSYYDTHEHGARRIARIAREMGVQRFIHMSALNASTEPTPVLIPGGSQFLRSKALGEIAVRDEFPDATIVRPAIIYGMYDHFIYHYVTRLRKTPINTISLYQGGVNTFKMPVYVGDVVAGLQRIVNDPSTSGMTFEFVGPYCYQLSELMDFMYAAAQCRPDRNCNYRRYIGFDPYLTMLVNLNELWQCIVKTYGSLSWEMIEQIECTNDVLTGVPTLHDLGLRTLTNFDQMGLRLCRERSFNAFQKEVIENEERVARNVPPKHPPLVREHPKERPMIETQVKHYEIDGIRLAPLSSSH